VRKDIHLALGTTIILAVCAMLFTALVGVLLKGSERTVVTVFVAFVAAMTALLRVIARDR